MTQTPEDARRTAELKKLETIVNDRELDGKIRNHAIDVLGDMADHEALLVLLSIVANDKLGIDERELALKRARDIVKKGR